MEAQEVVKETETRIYMTRKMPVDLHMRIKILAARRQEAMEDIVNMLLEEGLKVYEKQ